MIVILMRIDSQNWDKDLRLKARYLRHYRPEDFGLEPYLALNPNDKITKSRIRSSIKVAHKE